MIRKIFSITVIAALCLGIFGYSTDITLADARRFATAWTQTSVTVTNAATTIIASVNVAHDILLQNNDAAGIVYINLSGAASVSNTMFVIQPNGGSLLLLDTTNAVSAIGSIASNANVAVGIGKYRK